MDKIKIAVSVSLGGLLSYYVGGFDQLLKALLLCMVVDYITGLIVALVFKNSTKTETGAASSKASFKGLVKKMVMILLIAVMVQVDLVLGTNSFFREATIWGFLANELMSLLENVGLMGFTKLPISLTNALDVLIKKAEGNKEEKGDV